jgi:hypothetical protein
VIFWAATPFNSAGGYQHFGEIYYLNFQIDTFHQTSVPTYKSTQRHNPQDHNLNFHCHVNLSLTPFNVILQPPVFKRGSFQGVSPSKASIHSLTPPPPHIRRMPSPSQLPGLIIINIRRWIIALMTEAVSVPEKSLNFFQTTRHNITQATHLQIWYFAYGPFITLLVIKFPFICPHCFLLVI